MLDGSMRTCHVAWLMLMLAILPLGCMQVRWGGPSHEVVLKDRDSGKVLDKCLVVRMKRAGQWQERAWYWPYVDSYADEFHIVEADIERIKSGQKKCIPSLVGFCYPTGLFTYKVREQRYEWMFFKDGYAPYWTEERSIVVEAKENRGRLVVEMIPELAYMGKSTLYMRTKKFVYDIMPVIPKSHPLRRELLLLLDKQLKRVFGPDEEDVEPFYAEIQSLLSEQPEGED